MVDPVLTGIASSAVVALMKGVADRAGSYLLGTDEERALGGVFERALATALERTIRGVDPDEAKVLEFVFVEWFSDVRVQAELLDAAMELRRPDDGELRRAFAESGFDERTLQRDLGDTILAFGCSVERELNLEAKRSGSALANRVSQDRIKQILELVRSSEASRSEAPAGTLPRRPKQLVGRNEELAELINLLGGSLDKDETDEGAGSNIVSVALHGPPGVGKTTVAAELCWRDELSESFPDLILWASLGPSPDLLSTLAGWSRSVEGPDLTLCSSLEEASQRLTAFLRNKRMLLIVDDIFEAEHALPLNVVQGGAILYTTRSPEVARELTHTPDNVYPLRELSGEESVKLLRRVSPSLEKEVPNAYRSLARELGGLPLALRVAGRLLEEEAGYGWGISDLLDELRSGKALLESKASPRPEEASGLESPTVTALLNKSLERLDRNTRERFIDLAVVAAKPATFSLEDAEAIWETSDGKDALRSLVRRGLVEAADSGSFRIHPVLRIYARHLLAQDPSRLREGHVRHARHFIGVLRRADELYAEGSEGARKGSGLISASWENVRVAQAWAASQSEDEEALRLCSEIVEVGERWLTLRLPAGEHVEWAEAALRAADLLDDEAAKPRHLTQLGNAHLRSGRYKEASQCYEGALKRYHGGADRQAKVGILGNLGVCQRFLGNPATAESLFHEQIELAEDLDDTAGEARGRGNLGSLLKDTARPRDAIREISAAAKLFREAPDVREAAGATLNLGLVRLNLGELDQAERDFAEYLDMTKDLGDRDGESRALTHLGLVHEGRGDHRRAAYCHRKALRIAREQGNRDGESRILGSLAGAYARLGYIGSARPMYLKQRDIARETKNRLSEANALGNLGHMLMNNGAPDEALELLEDALKLYRKIGHRLGEANTLRNASFALADLGERDRALAYAAKALEIYKDIDSPLVNETQDQLDRWRDESE